MIRQLKLTALFLAYTLSAQAQSSDWGMWYNYFGNQKFKQRWNWHHEAQYRNYNVAGDLEQLLLRTGVGYNVFNDLNLLAGYAYIHSRPYNALQEKFTTTEHRLYQQLLLKHNTGMLHFQHRYRLEERFMANAIFKVRFRYFLSLQVPITKRAIQPQALYASMYNEVFLHAQKNTFDRNRLYGGLGYVLNKKLKMEIGLMTQMMPGGSRAQGQVMLFYNNPFTAD